MTPNGAAVTPIVLVPLKGFRLAKGRLAERLDRSQRHDLAQAMAAAVVKAAAPLQVRVVCDSDEVAQWARTMGAGVLLTPADGLNSAVTAAVAALESEAGCAGAADDGRDAADPEPRSDAPETGRPGSGASGSGAPGSGALGSSRIGSSCGHVLIAHADLPHAESLADLAEAGTVTIVPDRHLDGTNVLSLPLGTGFEFHYGPGSFRAHCDEALRRGLDLRVRRIAALALDVDTPEDLEAAGVGAERVDTASIPERDAR